MDDQSYGLQMHSMLHWLVVAHELTFSIRGVPAPAGIFMAGTSLQRDFHLHGFHSTKLTTFLPIQNPNPTATMTATPPPPFDLESYISRYPSNSETQLQRLLFLAHQFHNDPATHDAASTAFNLAVSKLKASGNHRRYLEEYEDSSPENTSPIRIPNKESKNHVIQHYVKYDAQFVSESKSSMASQLQVLEGRLGTAQSHINKEAIRTALLALGVFLKERGDLRESWRRVVRSR